jgi:hypothetical protein
MSQKQGKGRREEGIERGDGLRGGRGILCGEGGEDKWFARGRASLEGKMSCLEMAGVGGGKELLKVFQYRGTEAA